MLVVTLALMVLPLLVLIVLMVTISYKQAMNQIPEDAPVSDSDLYISSIAAHLHTQTHVQSLVHLLYLLYFISLLMIIGIAISLWSILQPL